MEPRLKDKIAIVTGAAKGIGKGIAEVFAEHGAAVLIADVDEAAGEATAAEIRKRGLAASFVRCDVSNESDVKRTVAMAAQKSGRIDVLCNNAAYIAEWHDIATASQEEWDRCVATVLMGTTYFTRHVLPHMIPHKSGSIINISSIQGLVGCRSSAPYSTVKHGLIGLTRSTAYDFGEHNIRVNVICPGAIKVWYSPEPGTELHTRQTSKTFLGRTGEVREIGYAALFLASDESSYVTGAVLPVDGGWTAM